MSKHRSSLMLSIAVLATLSPLAGAQSVWSGAGPATPGTLNTGSTTQQSISFLTWDAVDGANWGGTPYAVGNTTTFNSTTGSYVIAVASAMNPASMSFDGGATYDFVRANTSAGTNTNTAANAVAYGSPSVTYIAADSFTSASPFGAFGTTGTTGNYPLVTASTFTGKVYLGSRASATNYSPTAGTGTVNTSGGTVNTIAGGYVELRDQQALRHTGGSAAPAIRIDMTGGELAINLGTPIGYTFRTAASSLTSPTTGGFAGPLNVNGNASLTNPALDMWGRARQVTNFWNGPLNVPAGQTLTVNTGGGIQMGGNISNSGSGGNGNGNLLGSGTIKIGAAATSNGGSNRLRLNANYSNNNTHTLTFDLGTSGILQSTTGIGANTNLGALVAPAGTFLGGSNSGPSATSHTTNFSIGSANTNSTIAGIVTNGYATSAAIANPLAGRNISNTGLIKTGSGSLTISSAQYNSGAISVNVGTLVTSHAGALGGSSSAVTVASGATLDTNGFSQSAGKQYVLSGGSLVNNTGTAVTLGSGLSANMAPSNTVGTGSWSGAGNEPTVSFSGGGGSGATGRVLLQLGWISFAASDLAVAGSGYSYEPKIEFSAPDLAGGRAPKVVAAIDTNGAVVALDVVDPGWGYTKVPTVTISNPAGHAGATFSPVFAMTASAIDVTNAGSGYTSVPTVAIGGPGYLAGSANPVAGFGSVTLTAATTSNLGGSGNIVVDAVVTGAGNLAKTGAGIVTLTGVNNYSGTTVVNAGTLRVNGTNSGTGAVSVASGATLGGSGSIAGPVTFSANSIVGPGNSIGTLTLGSATIGGVFQVEYNGSAIDLLNVLSSLDITAATVDFDSLGAPPVTPLVFASYGSLTGTFAGVTDLPSGTMIDYNYNGLNQIALVVPEPTTLAAVGSVVVIGLRRRRK